MAYKVMGREKAPDVPVPSYRLPQATLEALSAIVKKLGTQKLISEEMVWDKNKDEYSKRSEYQGDITPDTHLVRFHESAEVWARNIIKQYRDAKLRGKLDTLVVHPNTFYFPGFELEGTTQPEPITFTTPAEQHEFAQNVISKGWGKKSSMVAPFSRTRDEFHKIQNILNDRSLETGEVLSRKRSWKEKISMLMEINKGTLKFHVFSLPPNMEKLVAQFNDGKLTAKQLKDELVADEHRFAESILIHNQIKEKNWNNYEVIRVSTKKADTSGITVESTAKAEPNRKREHSRRLKEQANIPMSQSSFISPEGRLELATSIAQSTNLPKDVSFTPGGIYILKRFEDMTVEEVIQEGNLKDYKPLMVRAEEYANNIVKFLNKTPDAIPAMAILLKKFYEYKETGGGRIKLSEAEDMANIGDDRSFAQAIINMQKKGFTSQQIFDAIFEEPKKGDEPSPANQFRDAAYFAFQRIFTDPTWKEITDAFMTKGGWKTVKEYKEPKTKKQAEAEASRPSPEEAEKQREVVISSKKDLIRSIRTDRSFKEGILEAINGVYEGSPEDKARALESNINKLNEQITELHHEYDKLDAKIEAAKADTSIAGKKRSQLLSLMNRQSTVFAELQDKRKFSDELLKKHDALLEAAPARKPKLVNVEVARNITNRLTELIGKIEDPRSLPKSGKELIWVMNKAALIAESSIQEKLRGSLAQTFLQEDEAAATAFVSEMGLGLEEHGRESKQSGSIRTPEGRQRAIEIKRRYSSMSDRMQVVNAQRIELLKRMDSMPEGRAKDSLRREVESRIEEIKYWEQALERDELTGALLGIDRSESHRQGIALEEWGEDEELTARELAGNKLLPEDIAENENKILRGLDILINGVEIARAPKTYSSFILDCKEILGNLWNHIKQYASKLWNRLNERRAFLKGAPVSSDTMHSTRDLSHAITVPGLAAIRDTDSVTAGQRIYATLTNHLAEASGKFSSDPVMQNYIEMFGKLWKGKLVNVNSTRDRWWQAFEYVAGPGAGVFANLTTRQSYALRDYLVREGVARRGNQWKDRSAIGTAAAEIGKRATKLRAKHYFRAAKNTIGPYDMVPKMIDHIFKNIKNDGVEVKLSDNWGMVKNGRNSRYFTRIADQKFFRAAQATGLIPFDLWERVSNPARFDIKDVRVIKQFNKRQRLVQVKLDPRNSLSFLHDTKDNSYKLLVGSEDINHHGNAEFFRRIDALERSQGREAVKDEAGKFTVTESWLKSQLPTATITAESDNTFRAILPGGYGFRISANNEVLKGISESGEEVDLAGNWTLDKLSGGLISIAKLSKEGTATTLDHEVFHMATDIFLTKSEQALMTDMYGSWEQAAVAYENWIPAGNIQMGTANPSFFGKLLQSIRDLLFHLKSWLFNYSPYMQRNRLFTEIRSGRAFNRIPSLNLHSYPNEKFRIEWLGNSTAIVVRDGRNAKLYDPTMGASNRILDTLPMESENKELLKRIFKPASHETILTDRPILKRIIDRLSKDDEKLQAELGIKGLEPGTAEYMYSLPFWLKMEKTDSKLALVLKLGKSGYIVETNDAGLKVSKYPFHAIASEIEDRRFGEKSQLDYDFYKKTKTFQTLKDSEIKPLYPIMLWSTIHGERYLTWQELKNPSFIRKVYEKMGETAPSYELSDYQARAYQEAAQQMDEMYDKQIAALELANLAPYQRNLTAKEFTVLKTLYKDLVNNKTPNLNLLERPNLIHKTTDASGKTRTTNPTKTAWNNLSKKLEDIRKLRSQISKSKGYFPLKHQAGAYYTVVIRRWKSSDPSTWEKGETVAYYGSKTLAQAKETEDFLRALPEYTDMEIKSNRSSNPHESTYWEVGDFNTARMVDLAVQKASFDKDITWEQARNLSDAAHYAIVDMLRIRGAAQSAVGRKVLQWKDQKYAKGYVTDKLRDVVNAYATGYNGMHTKMKAAIEYVELIGAIPANMPNTYDQISAYANNMLRNKDNIDQKIGFLKRRAFEFYLLGKVSMAYLQMVQNFVTAIPALTVDMKQAGFKNWATAAERYYTKAMIDRAAWKYNEAFLPEDEQRFLHEGQRRGYMMARFVSDLKAQAAPVNMQILKAGFDALAWPIEGMEILNRESAALAYYRFMKADPTLSKLSFEEMQKRTAEYINRTHFQYGKGNLPSWAADSSMLSKFANLAYTFVPFTHNFTLSVVHMFRSNGGTEGVVYLGKSMFYLALFGGIPALPGVDEIVDLCEMLTKRPLRAELRAFINKRAGGLAERFALSGIPGLINIDVSAAVKPVQLPGFLRGEDINKSIFGVMGGIVQGAAKGVSTAYNHGDYLKAAELALPTALANVFKAYRLTFRGATYPSSGLPVEVGEDARQLKLDVYTPGGWIPYLPTIMQGFGFKNYDYSQNMEDLWTMRKMRMKFVEKEQALRVQYRLADSPESKLKVSEKIRELNRGIPDALKGIIKPMSIPSTYNRTSTRAVRSYYRNLNED
jgi:outer membrane murein-binding lipoprotein Lpp